MASRVTYDDVWDDIPWKQFQKNLARLQHRIYKAALNSDYGNVINLQNLLVDSTCARYLAIKQAMESPVGKKVLLKHSPSVLSSKDTLLLVTDFISFRKSRSFIREKIFVPTFDGKKRLPLMLKLKHIASQFLIKYALDPYYQATISYDSHGCSSNCSLSGILNILLWNLNHTYGDIQKRVLKVDVKKCFDIIDFEKLLSHLVLPNRLKTLVRHILKSSSTCDRRSTNNCLSQIGILSFLLSNIALHKVEFINNKVGIENSSAILQRGFRYGAGLVYFLRELDDPIFLRDSIVKFLDDRGLQSKEIKISSLHSVGGFGFFGWRFLSKDDGYFGCYPGKENIRTMNVFAKNIFKSTCTSFEGRICQFTYLFKNWRNYFRFSGRSEVRASLWRLRLWIYRFIRRKVKLRASRQKFWELVRKVFDSKM